MCHNYEPIFRNDLLQWRLNALQQSPEQLATRAVSSMTIRRAVEGKSIGSCKLRAIADLVGINPKYLFDFNLTERQFYRAVLNGHSASGR